MTDRGATMMVMGDANEVASEWRRHPPPDAMIGQLLVVR
jgi:hypothetical protein